VSGHTHHQRQQLMILHRIDRPGGQRVGLCAATAAGSHRRPTHPLRTTPAKARLRYCDGNARSDDASMMPHRPGREKSASEPAISFRDRRNLITRRSPRSDSRPRLPEERRDGLVRAVRRAQPHLESFLVAAQLDHLDQAALRRQPGTAEFIDRPGQPPRPDSRSVRTSTHEVTKNAGTVNNPRNGIASAYFMVPLETEGCGIAR
jgi:hypothetical protein